MCGIFGVISRNNTVSEEGLKASTSSLTHRGPDFNDVYLSADRKVGLGHTRLSILDLSSKANQPFHSSNGRYIMVFNGEIYNYKELAEELGSKVQSELKSSGDTEVLLKAFELFGKEFVTKLNGMFSIAIWDTLEDSLYLFRDRMGIKPLYIFQNSEYFAFSSELKGFLDFPEIKNDLKLDDDAFYAYMHMGFVPEPLSIYDKVQKFPAGSLGVFKTNNYSIFNYWNIDEQLSDSLINNEGQAHSRLNDLLIDSVQKRLVSDVPLGTFLSGGIDSSTVTSIASELLGGNLKTFSIGFSESKYNESTFAKNIADYLKTDHTEFILSEQDAIPFLENMVDTFDEPFADTSGIPTMLISKLARDHVKVILTGDGGDEQFLGYGAYTWADRLANPFLNNSLVKNSAAFVLSQGNSRAKRIAGLFKNVADSEIRSHIFSQEQYLFGNKELQKLVSDYKGSHLFQHKDSILSKRSAAERQSIFDLKYYLRDDLLTKVDRSSMKYGLECRVPLLDHKLVEFTLNLDKSLKLRNGESKYLLKRVLYNRIPAKFFYRPKWGFSVPLEYWLKNDMSYLISDYLNKKTCTELGFFNFDTVSELLRRFNNGDSYLYNRLWQLINFHKWAIQYNMSA